MGWRVPPAVVTAVVAAVVTGCGAAVPGPLSNGAPPPVSVRGGGQELALQPWSYCWGNGCADGAPPRDPPDLGSPERVEVSFPRSGWSFLAELRPAGQPCGRVQTVPLTETGEDGRFTLAPAGPAGAYDVTLMGRGRGSDVAASFRWTTPVDGPMPVPSAELAVLADHDGQVDSYGVELIVANLAATPQEANATVTVTPARGEPVRFDAARVSDPCLPEGTVRFDGPDAPGLAAASAGPPPSTYDVLLVLDGEEHRGTATWPRDEIPGFAPYADLEFEPPLPALTG